MTTLEVTFPDLWATVSTTRVRHRVPELGSGAQDGSSGQVTDVLPAVAGLSVGGFASVSVPDPECGSRVAAFCLINDVPRCSSDEADLRALAEGGLHVGLERDTSTVRLPVGPAFRSSAFRFDEELLDDVGRAPYAFEVRFVFPLPGHRAGVLHFETTSLSYLDDLESLFDAIAGTATLA